jgi:hypothetical protein
MIAGKILAHKTAGQWLSGAQNQVTLIWKDPETKVECKGRIDVLRPDRIIELKTTQSAQPSMFHRLAYNMKYHVGAAIYHDAYLYLKTGAYPTQIEMAVSLIVAETEPPYDVVCYDYDEESLLAGRMTYRVALERYLNCMTEKIWRGYSDVAEPISIPAWALNRINNEGAVE